MPRRGPQSSKRKGSADELPEGLHSKLVDISSRWEAGGIVLRNMGFRIRQPGFQLVRPVTY